LAADAFVREEILVVGGCKRHFADPFIVVASDPEDVGRCGGGREELRKGGTT
jgi:hypothetical protein